MRWGRERTEGWRADPRPVDVWTATGLAATLARAAGVRAEARANAAPYFHPVRQARLVSARLVDRLGRRGAPAGAARFDVAGPVAAVVLDLEALQAAAGAAPQYEDLLTVPVSTRDLALVVAEPSPPPTWWPPRARRARRWCATSGCSTATPARRSRRAT